MKYAPPAVVSFLAAQQAAPSSDMGFVELYTITMQSGTVLRISGADAPITIGGQTWIANSILIDGLKWRATLGADVDEQEISISINYAAAAGAPTINGMPFMTAMALGLFDLATIQRDRAVFSGSVGGTINIANLVGVIPALYKGRFIEVKPGRLQAKVTVANSLVVLQQNMPRRTFAPTCQHVFGDSFCTVNQTGSTSWAGTVAGSRSTTTLIDTVESFVGQVGGTLAFTSGANSGYSSTVIAANPGVSVTVLPAFANAPASGDVFTVTRANSSAGVALSGSTQQVILSSVALFLHAGGTVTFTSGANEGLTGTVSRATAGATLWMQYPFPEPIAAGDAFVVTLGCDHTEAMCINTYNNLVNFLGFSQIPPPQTATG